MHLESIYTCVKDKPTLGLCVSLLVLPWAHGNALTSVAMRGLRLCVVSRLSCTPTERPDLMGWHERKLAAETVRHALCLCGPLPSSPKALGIPVRVREIHPAMQHFTLATFSQPRLALFLLPSVQRIKKIA